MKNILQIIKSCYFLYPALLSLNSLILSPVLAEKQIPLSSFLGNLEKEQRPVDRQQEMLIERPIYISQPPAIDNIYNVHQLKDVSPEDWAYEALNSLIERYRCISGFPNGSFRGNRTISRYEFAAALNTCLLTMNRLVDNFNTTSGKQDLVVIKRLQAEFAPELQKMTARVGNLEQRVAFVEDNQFSTTTILRGKIDFNITSDFGGNKAVLPGNNTNKPLNTNLTFSARSSLTFDTSFTGRDKLRASFQSGNNSNYNRFITGTDMTLLSGRTNTREEFRLGTVFYQFPLSDRIIAAVAPAADFPTRVFPALNPVSSISNFGSESPIFSYASGSGAVIYYNITDELSAGVSYLTINARDSNRGLFSEQYTILSQITYTPIDKIGIAFTYGRYYSPAPISANITGSKGSQFGEFPFGSLTPTSSNNFGLQFTYQFTEQFTLGGWVSYFNPQAEGSPSVSGLTGIKGSNADIWSWAMTAAIVDLGKQGSQLNFILGMPPKVKRNSISERQDLDTAFHIEISYDYPITDRIKLTPGFLVIINPEHNAANSAIGIGLVRTSFSF